MVKRSPFKEGDRVKVQWRVPGNWRTGVISQISYNGDIRIDFGPDMAWADPVAVNHADDDKEGR